MTQLELDFAAATSEVFSAVDWMAQRARQRILDGLVDEYGRERPEGPRKKLTPAQMQAYALMRKEGGARGCRPGPTSAGTLSPMR